jgi:hypothetical protein
VPGGLIETMDRGTKAGDTFFGWKGVDTCDCKQPRTSANSTSDRIPEQVVSGRHYAQRHWERTPVSLTFLRGYQFVRWRDCLSGRHRTWDNHSACV